MLKLKYLLLTGLFYCVAAGANASPEKFAYQAELSNSNQSLQRVEIPLEVLLAVTRQDLADIRVFDNNGQALPGLVRRAPRQNTRQQIELPFHIFSSYYQEKSKTVTTREQSTSADQVSEIQTTETISIDQSRPVYIIEFPIDSDGVSIESIALQWTHKPANQMLKLRVEVSNNLDDWRTIQPSKNLTNQNADKDEWQTIGSIPTSNQYLRLTPLDSVEFFELEKVTGTYYQPVPETWIWHRLEPMDELKDQPGFYAFNMPTAVQAAKLKLVPGTEQSLVGGELYASRTDFEHKRRIRGKFQQHNILGDEIRPSKALNITQHRYKHWWFKPDRQLAVLPHVEITYPVYEMLFLGNGNGPYRLAWGNFEISSLNNDLANLLTDAQKKNQADLVHPGPVVIVGGDARLAAPEQLPWLKWLLWLFMAAAVVATAKMALSLLRDMKTGQHDPQH